MKINILFLLFFTLNAFGMDKLSYTFIQKGLEDNNTLLVFGGIQGDEPGGFLAASLLSTDYNITKGSVWIVPNLNFPSIIKRSRGLNGDLNRKFSSISKKDPDFGVVKDVKNLIKDAKVSLVVNLHDGSGFYNEKYINSQINPNRWGNSAIIDQEKLNNIKYGNLLENSTAVIDHINLHLLDEKHRYHVKNTRTKEGDVEMLKSLTYYAVINKKAAYANEASKSLPTHLRVYYHLLALEKYMQLMNIQFTRNFDLSPEGVKQTINKGVELSLYDKKIYLNLDNPRSIIRYIPMPKKGDLTYSANNPLTAVIKDNKGYGVYYGNRKLTKLVPEYFDYAVQSENVKVDIDGSVLEVPLGSLVKVENYFKVLPIKGQRVNVIGYTHKKYKNEVDIKISKKMIQNHYSIDKNAKIFRVEFYDVSNDKKGEYIGMILVEFAFN